MLFKKFQYNPTPLRVWLLLFIIIFFSCFVFETPAAYSLTKKQRIEAYKRQTSIEIVKQRKQNIESKRKQTKQKIQQLKQQEYVALKTLQTNEYKLMSARTSLRDQQYRLSMATSQLDKLQASLMKLSNDQKKLKEEAAKRVKQIYKGERLSLFHMILGARDITSFLDRVYYQQRIINRDREFLNELIKKTGDLTKIRQNLKNQKDNIISSINNIEGRQKEISIAVSTNKEIVNRLKTDRRSYEAAENQLAKESIRLESTIRSILSSGASKVSLAKGAFLRPVSGYISSPYGWRRHPIFGSRKFHTGVDIAGRNRSPIKATNNGKVIYTGWYGGYGKVVIIDHGKATASLYAHLSSINVSNGQTVSKGTTIGNEGSTGYSTGPHLHFEIRLNGKHTNPMSYIP